MLYILCFDQFFLFLLFSLSTALFRVQKFQHTGIRGHRYIIVCCTETEEELGGELRERERGRDERDERKQERKGEGEMKGSISIIVHSLVSQVDD